MLEENREIVGTLVGLAAALDFAGENPHKGRAFRRVARTLAGLPRPLRELRTEGLLDSIHGIGRSSAEAIETLLSTGRLPRYEAARAGIPSGLIPLLEHLSLDARRLGELHRALGIADRESAIRSLRTFAHRGSGLTDGEARRLLRSIETAPILRPGPIPLEEAIVLGRRIRELLQAAEPGLQVIESAELRRRSPGLTSLSFLAVTACPASAIQAFLQIERVGPPILLEESCAEAVLKDGWKARVRTVAPPGLGIAHLLATGSAAHLTGLEDRAASAGMRVCAAGLRRGEAPVACATEEAIYAALGIAWIPPELREGRGEIEAGAAGTVPRVVERADLRWDAGLLPASALAIEQTLRTLRRRGDAGAGVVCSDLPGEPPGSGDRRRTLLEAARDRFRGFPVLETGTGLVGTILFLPPWDEEKERQMGDARGRGLRVAIGSGATHPAGLEGIEGGLALARRAGLPGEQVVLAPPV